MEIETAIMLKYETASMLSYENRNCKQAQL